MDLLTRVQFPLAALGEKMLPRGMRDLKPEEEIKKEVLADRFRFVAKKYGFVPLQTPVIEMYDTLAAKGAVKEEIYYFEDKSDRALGLRFDLTVPLARFVSENLDLKMPFRRYQIGEVFRYDRPQKGRYRQFTQADIDIVGFKDSFSASYEILSFALSYLDEIGVKAKIKVSDRRIVEEFLRAKGITEIDKAFTIIDKMPKIGLENAKRMFSDFGFDSSLLDVFYNNDSEEIKKVCGKENIEFLERLISVLSDSRLVIDFSIVRGLGYYTGVVLEVDAGQIIGGGGQYSNLVSAFSSRSLDAIGMSFGLDRVMEYFDYSLLNPKVFLYFFPESKEYGLKIAEKLRSFGISVIFEINNKSISEAISNSLKSGIPYFLTVGSEEEKKQTLVFKNLENKEQKEFLVSDFSSLILEIK